MLRPGAGEASRSRWQERAAGAAVAGALVACAIIVAVEIPHDRVNALTAILGLAAVTAGVMVAGQPDGLSVSAGFIVAVLAAVFLGPASAAAAAVITELFAAQRLKTRVRSVLLINLPASVVPAVAAGLLIKATGVTAAD